MDSFITALEKGTNKQTETANGALSNKTTLDPLLDFFSNAGAMRGKEAEAVKLFNRAFIADPENAIRCLFYLRDIRGGQGERSVFRAIVKSLDDSMVSKIAQYIPLYGRWDEVPLTDATVVALKEMLEQDERMMKEGKAVSLLAKWLPSENTSSAETHKKAIKLYRSWGITARQYRTRVVALRKYIGLLEQKMSSKEWPTIEYGKLPTQAHRKHVKAFYRNDQTRYEAYLGAVEKGEAKINSGTAFTYELYDMAHNSGEARTADAMWKALPDYTNGQNALVLADVSGSMFGRPMSISVSLALYFAERNTGPFREYFLVFSSDSYLEKVRGTTLTDKLQSIQSSTGWCGSTNLQSAFDAILTAGINSQAKQSDMPKTLYIISDMQFNIATTQNKETNFEVAQRKFQEAGYELPHVVFWNCNSQGKDAPATMYDDKVTLISGSNQSTFQYAVVGKTPIQSMLDILNSERYAQIKL